MMKCGRCQADMLQAKLVGAQHAELLLVNKKQGIWESEKRSTVSCYVCPACGHIELIADHPAVLQMNGGQTR